MKEPKLTKEELLASYVFGEVIAVIVMRLTCWWILNMNTYAEKLSVLYSQYRKLQRGVRFMIVNPKS